MKQSLRQELLTKYPEWHLNPFRLSIDEIAEPFNVLDHFFQCHTLPQIRACLKELVHDSLMAEDTDAPSHITTYEDVEKLIEAAWVIVQKGDWQAKLPSRVIQDSEKKEFPVCYQFIDRFFDAFPLPFARSYLLSSIKAAESSSVWKKKAPADLIYFFDCLNELIAGVFDLLETGNKTAEIDIDKEKDPFAANASFLAAFDKKQSWDHFPRSLSRKEYLNPHTALHKFSSWASKKEWKQTLHYLLTYALGANSLAELGINLGLVRITELLEKMLDGCHLILVRVKRLNN